MIDVGKIKGIILDYGGTLDTNGCHWGRFMYDAYVRSNLKIVTEKLFRQVYVSVEKELGSSPYIKPDDTFRYTLNTKLMLQLQQFSMIEADLVAHVDEDKVIDLFRTYKVNPEKYPITAASNKAMTNILLDDIYGRVKENMKTTWKVLEVLNEKYPLILCSNFYGNLDTVVKEFGISQYFKTIIESAKVGIRKPDPAIFLLSLNALSMEPDEVVVVGDSIKNDIVPAHNLGIQTVWLKGKPWKEESCDFEPDAVISGLDQLPGLFDINDDINLTNKLLRLQDYGKKTKC